MKYTYEEITTESFTGSNTVIKRTDEDGIVLWIPIDPANSDYQQYLNPTEHLQTIVPQVDETSAE